MPSENRTETRKFIHELKNHLNNIAVNGQLARLLLEKGSPETDVISKIDKIVDGTRKTADMVQVWYEQSDTKQ